MSTRKRKICVGLLAHVDAGKTTLSEALLCAADARRTRGRVDRGNTLLDFYSVERERGITVFSKGARLSLPAAGDAPETELILLDTPGHVDFAPETERTLPALDAAVLIVSAPDGVQSHTRTLWGLLRAAGIPTFLFLNKTDLPCPAPKDVVASIQRELDERCFLWEEAGENARERAERLALCREDWMELHLAGTGVSADAVGSAVTGCEFFPVFCGSALAGDGVASLLSALQTYVPAPDLRQDDAPGAVVYQIRYTDDGIRTSLCRVTSGTLSVRDTIRYRDRRGRPLEEKITQIRIYNGNRFTTTEHAEAGEVCAVIGLTATYPGEGLGSARDAADTRLQPMLSYRLLLPPETAPDSVWPSLARMEEEEPCLALYRTEDGGIDVHLMGAVQTEVMAGKIAERLGVPVTFGRGQIIYRETLAAPAVGVGHYEPLRHYAEVHLAMTPLPRGMGLVFETDVSEDVLPRRWQHLVLSALYEGDHRGVLTGSVLTDVKITLIAAGYNLKHTDGGDIRAACLRAVRQGLMTARAADERNVVLLEPILSFTLSVPNALAGRALSDLQTGCVTCDAPEITGDTTVITGVGPYAYLHDYAAAVAGYTHGVGLFTAAPAGYAPAHDRKAVIAARGYDAAADLAHPPHSIFCAHGAGFLVPWDQVPAYMHLHPAAPKDKRKAATEPVSPLPRRRQLAQAYDLSTEEVEAIMTREFGPIKRPVYKDTTEVITVNGKKCAPRVREKRPVQYLIDGYNLIFAWDELCEVANADLERARRYLCDVLSDYVAFTHAAVTLVFDAYRVPGNDGRTETYNGFTVVYTATGQTADAWLQTRAHELGPDYDVRVVTSDRLVQVSALAAGVVRCSSREFREELIRTGQEIRAFIARMNAAETAAD